MKDAKYTGMLQAIESQNIFEKDISAFIDHMLRKDSKFIYHSHSLHTLHEYMDYYHILLDVMATRIIEEKITHMLFFDIPHLGYDTIVYQIGKALGLKITILAQSLFPNQFFSMSNIEDYGIVAYQDIDCLPMKIERHKTQEWFYMKKIQQGEGKKGRISIKAYLHIILFVMLKQPKYMLHPKEFYTLFRRASKVYNKLPTWRDPFAKYFHVNALEYFEHLVQYEKNTYSLDVPFVYFSLQMQPEMTTSALGGWYRDQALAIESLALLLPDDVKIYVKENPKQGMYMRGPMFFHRLRRIPSVVILPSYANTHELTEKAIFVSTITGTVGWEAIQKGKCVLAFGNAWYRSLPGVFNYHEDMLYEEICSYEIDHTLLEKKMGELLYQAHQGVINRHYTKIVQGYNQEENLHITSKIIWALLQERIPLTFAKMD